jgi:hypothetical protein
VEGRFSQFGDSVNLDTSARFAPNVQYALKSFLAHPIDLLGDVGQGKACLGLLEIVLISAQERCTICIELTIDSEIILDTPNGTPF